MFLKRKILAVLALYSFLGTQALADSSTTGGSRVIENPSQDGDLIQRINDGGTKKDVYRAVGATGQTIVGAVGDTAGLSVNGPVLSSDAVKAANGTAGAPSLSFTGTPNTGAFRSAASTFGISAGGTLRWDVDTADITFTLPQKGAAGTNTAPTYSFSGDPNTGVYSNGADRLAFAAGGAIGAEVRNDGTTTTDGIYVFDLPVLADISTTITPNFLGGYSFDGDTNTGMFWPGADQIGFAVGGVKIAEVNAGGIALEVTGDQFAGFNSANASLPDFSFSGDGNTGMYSSADGTVAFSSNGAAKLVVAPTAVQATVSFQGYSGNDPLLPDYAFDTDVDTGMYRSASNQLSFSTGGVRYLTIGSTGNIDVVAGNVALAADADITQDGSSMTLQRATSTTTCDTACGGTGKVCAVAVNVAGGVLTCGSALSATKACICLD